MTDYRPNRDMQIEHFLNTLEMKILNFEKLKVLFMRGCI